MAFPFLFLATFTLAIVGYLDSASEQSGLTIEQVATTPKQHRELISWRVAQALEWAENASPSES